MLLNPSLADPCLSLHVKVHLPCMSVQCGPGLQGESCSEKLTLVTSGSVSPLLLLFIYFSFNHVCVDQFFLDPAELTSGMGYKGTTGPHVNTIRGIHYHKGIANLASVSFIGFVIFGFPPLSSVSRGRAAQL